jgi:hypothetical protein
MRKWYYTFDAEDIHKFKFCPMCGGKDSVYVSDGDYDGMIQCLNCPDDDDYINFTITYDDVKQEPWSMDKEEYFRLKSDGWKDESIAAQNSISTRTLDRWKNREGIYDSLHRRGLTRYEA